MPALISSIKPTRRNRLAVGAIALKSPAALRDLERISGYLCEQKLDVAHRFLDAAESAFSLLASNPLLGEPFAHPRYSDLRFRTLRPPFRNYVLFYRPSAEGVEIVRLLHGARDLPIVLE
ncbi:type II toxin-antitoxin system RelE/ParE family toxin [Pirellulimonas nuda]|uniref:type II toxin-antitoxin system RelE/ParE family toxin n=1 Tax=Pirellulimonas nuda TaxID=2528009 RepID=UPI0018D443F7